MVSVNLTVCERASVALQVRGSVAFPPAATEIASVPAVEGKPHTTLCHS